MRAKGFTVKCYTIPLNIVKWRFKHHLYFFVISERVSILEKHKFFLPHFPKSTPLQIFSYCFEKGLCYQEYMTEAHMIYDEFHAVLKRWEHECVNLSAFSVIGALEAVKADYMESLKQCNLEDDDDGKSGR